MLLLKQECILVEDNPKYYFVLIYSSGGFKINLTLLEKIIIL